MRYNYEELEKKALSADATEDDINALGEWFEQYGGRFWNGECYDIDRTHCLYPIYKEILDENGDLDYAEIVGWEVR